MGRRRWGGGFCCWWLKTREPGNREGMMGRLQGWGPVVGMGAEWREEGGNRSPGRGRPKFTSMLVRPLWLTSSRRSALRLCRQKLMTRSNWCWANAWAVRLHGVAILRG
jgi:hypothetical protein